MTDNHNSYTKAEMETQVAIARVETLVSVTRDDFIDHKADDERNFGEIFEATRNVGVKIDAIPGKILQCRDDLKVEIHSEMTQHFVSQIDFKVFTTQVIWAIIGGTSIASVIAWGLSIAYTTTKLVGAG